MEEPWEEEEITEAEEDIDVLGLYLAEVARTPLLSEAEEKELVWRMKQGDRAARERLIVSHLRLVVSVAKEYGDTGLDLLDLIQEGNIGLIEAVDRYDPSRGVRLSTYARWWIRQAIGQAIEKQSQMIRIPAYLFRAIVRFQRLKASFGAEGIEETEDLLVAPGLTAERLLRIHETVGNVVSLDVPLDDEESTTLEELVADEEMPTPERAAVLELFREELLEMVEKLPARDAQVLRWRYGLEGPRPLTLAEIGQKLGVSRGAGPPDRGARPKTPQGSLGRKGPGVLPKAFGLRLAAHKLPEFLFGEDRDPKLLSFAQFLPGIRAHHYVVHFSGDA
jgi:RNA polymerase primary sigma factor